MVEESYAIPVKVMNEEWANARCDKYDYLIAAFCGGVAGFIDVVFVGSPLNTKLGGKVDGAVDGVVKKAAQILWKNDPRKKGRRRTQPETLEQCISYLEQAFPVNYDARYKKDLNVGDGVLSDMTSKNHHLKSLGHSPDIIGLFFSILDQFTGEASFVDNGHIIRVTPTKVSKAIPYLQGSNFISKLFCGFANWIGHIISDLVGSSSTRKVGKNGRGAGVSIPFYELFQFCDFGNIQGMTIAELMTKVFESGYDVRFGITMAIPVVLNELMIRAIWSLRQLLIKKKPVSDCLPTKAHADLRIMLIVGNATLCTVDSLDAARHGIMTGSVVTFVTYLNFIGWARLVMLVLQELYIRLSPMVKEALNRFVSSVLADLGIQSEKQLIYDFYARAELYDKHLDELYKEFVATVKEEYRILHEAIDATFDESKSSFERAQSSVELARLSGVPENEIIKNDKDLDDMFL